jgi:hypothetical protein
MKYTITRQNLDGQGDRPTRTYAMPRYTDYWSAVTDVPCPLDSCDGMLRWAENGYVPGYRICDHCGRHYLAAGDLTAPVLYRVGTRRALRTLNPDRFNNWVSR